MGAAASSAEVPRVRQAVGLTPSPARQTPSTEGASDRPSDGTGHWRYESDDTGEWTPFPDDSNERLEQAFKENRASAEVLLGRTLYTVAFASGAMTSTSGASRRVLRDVTLTDDLSVAKEQLNTSNVFGISTTDSPPPATGPDVVETTAGGHQMSLFVNHAQGKPLQLGLAAAARAHSSLVYCAAFTVDGKLVASGSRDGTFRFWEVDTGYIRREYSRIPGIVLSCAISSNSRTIATGAADSTLRVYGTDSDAPLWAKIAHSNKIYGVQFSCDGKSLLTGAMDAAMKVWDVETTALKATFDGMHSSSIFSITCGPYSPQLAVTGSDDTTMCLYDLRTPSVVAKFRGHTATIWGTDVRFDEKLFASAGMDGKALLWDPRMPETPFATVGEHGVPIHKVEFCSSGSRILTCARDSTWRLWNIDGLEPAVAAGEKAERGGEEAARVHAHQGTVFVVTHCAVRNQVLSIGSDAMIRLWDVPGL